MLAGKHVLLVVDRRQIGHLLTKHIFVRIKKLSCLIVVSVFSFFFLNTVNTNANEPCSKNTMQANNTQGTSEIFEIN